MLVHTADKSPALLQHPLRLKPGSLPVEFGDFMRMEDFGRVLSASAVRGEKQGLRAGVFPGALASEFEPARSHVLFLFYSATESQ